MATDWTKATDQEIAEATEAALNPRNPKWREMSGQFQLICDELDRRHPMTEEYLQGLTKELWEYLKKGNRFEFGDRPGTQYFLAKDVPELVGQTYSICPWGKPTSEGIKDATVTSETVMVLDWNDTADTWIADEETLARDLQCQLSTANWNGPRPRDLKELLAAL